MKTMEKMAQMSLVWPHVYRFFFYDFGFISRSLLGLDGDVLYKLTALFEVKKSSKLK